MAGLKSSGTSSLLNGELRVYWQTSLWSDQYQFFIKSADGLFTRGKEFSVFPPRDSIDRWIDEVELEYLASTVATAA